MVTVARHLEYQIENESYARSLNFLPHLLIPNRGARDDVKWKRCMSGFVLWQRCMPWDSNQLHRSTSHRRGHFTLKSEIAMSLEICPC